jgi:hypothetical protein
MTNRYLAQDCRDLAITLLQSVSSGFNVKIGIINTERTHTTPTITDTTKGITYKWGQNQFPFILVDIDNSEADYDSPNTPLSLNYTLLPEVYTLNVMGFLKYTNDNIYNYAEDWIEAIIRVLHNYNDTNVSWIAYTNTERADIYKSENETLKSFLIQFEVRVN